MDDDDNSLEYEEQVKVSLNLFMDCYDEYMKIELSNPTKAQVKEMTILSGQIGSIIEDVNRKIGLAINCYENSKRSKFYQNNIKSLQRKKENLDRLTKKFQQRLQENNDYLSDYSFDDTKANTITKEEEDTNDNITYNEEDIAISKEDIEEGEDKLFQLKEIIEDDKNFLGCSKEEMAEIIEIKNQLKELLALTRKQIEAENQKLLDIEELVEYSAHKVEVGNEELKKAALIKNKNNKMKLQLLFAGILGGLGTFVNIIPGVGNALGAFLGTKVGKLMSKIDEKTIDNIDKKYNKIKKGK